MLRRYKEKTPKALNAVLLSTPYFQANWKAILSTYHLLNCILRWNMKDKDSKGASEITWRFFYDVYGASYTQAIQAMEAADLLNVTRELSEGHCFMYLLTSKAHRVLNDSNKEYLHTLLTDKQERRRNQKRISDRGYNAKTYGDVRDEHKATIDGIVFDETTVNEVCDKYPEAKAACVRSLLISIVQKDYSDLKYNGKDGRVWTPYAPLPAEIKAVIKVNGYSYQGTMDIRSCYPSMWGRYVFTLASNQDALQGELERYEAIFLDKLKDPRTVLSLELGIDRSTMKDVLIQYFNGHPVTKRKGDPFRKFDAYLQAQFPNLYANWRKTNVKETGNNIGTMFETKLMLDQSIYEKAEGLGVAIGYEYDGMSFYAENDSNINALCDYIEERSRELLGFSLVIVQKDNRELLAQLATTTLVEGMLEEVLANDKQLEAMRRKNHRKSTINVKGRWKPYYALKQDNDKLLKRLKELYPLL